MSDERRDDEGRDEPAGPPEEEEKGLGLTEEFARLEDEIRREVAGEPESGGEEEPSGGEEEPPGDEHDAGEPAAADEPVAAYCDAARLERVLHNIIGNAIKYTSAFRTDGSGQIQVEVACETEHVICRVSDNGPGIMADDLARLGQRFQRAERSTAGAGGTGIGLHFCKGVLEASGGDLRIESDGIGLGSCMTVVLAIPPA